jgi:phage shock protein PspC (stress-responsive transcriptional regulator)
VGAYFEIDPIWVRWAFVVLTIFGGVGVLLYIAGWVLMPAVDFAPPAGSMQPHPVRRLYRLRNDRVIAGVASGLGAHLEVDPVWIRLAFVVLAFVGGLGVLLYIVGCIAMPSVDSIPPGGPWPGGSWPGGTPVGGAVPSYRGHGGGTDLRIVAGAVFLIVAVFVLAGNFDFHDTGLIWGAALIGIGLLFLIGDHWPSRYPAGGAPLPPPDFARPAAYSPPVGGPGEVPPAPPAATPSAVPSFYSAYTPYTPQPAYAGSAYGTPAAWLGRTSRSSGFRLGTIGLAAVILALGVALLLQSVGVIHLTTESGFGIVLLVLGITLVVGARFGGSGGLVALGICLLPFAAAAVLVPEPLAGGVGNVSYAPPALSAVQPTYRLAAGQLYVDLSGADLGGGNVAVTSSVAFGHLVVVVPPDTTVDVTGKVGAGEDDLLGRIDSGVQLSSHLDVATGPTPVGTLTLNVSVGCGQLTVETGGE